MTTGTARRFTLSSILPFVTAAIVTIMSLVQLLDFEQFLTRTASYLGLQGTTAGAVLSVGMVATQVLALPFLLGLTMGAAARFFSALCVLLAPTLWLVLALHATLQNTVLVECSCLFRIDIGLTHVFISTAFFALAIASFIKRNGAKALSLRK